MEAASRKRMIDRRVSKYAGAALGVLVLAGGLTAYHLSPFTDTGMDARRLSIPTEGIRMGTGLAAKYLLSGWSYPEGDFRWTDGLSATIKFAGEAPGPDEIEMELRPHLPPGKIGGQHIRMLLNGHEAWTTEVTTPQFATYLIPLPERYRGKQDTLKFILPDAVAPVPADQPGDHRRLGIAVRYIGRAVYSAIPDEGILMATNNAMPYLLSGWSYPESDFRWTDGRSAAIRFAGGRLDQDAIEMDLRPHLVPGTIDNQHMKILLNDQEIWMMELTAPAFAPYVISLPTRHLRRHNTLEFIFPDAGVQTSAETTKDDRRLGVAVRSIHWAQNQPIPDEGIRVGTDAAAPYLGAGWSYPEGEFRWTDGRSAAVRFAAGNPIPEAIEIDLRPYLVGKIDHQHMGVLLNGRQVWAMELTSPEFAQYVIPMPADQIRGQNVLTLILPGAEVPVSMGQPKDGRRLGVAVRTIRRAKIGH